MPKRSAQEKFEYYRKKLRKIEEEIEKQRNEALGAFEDVHSENEEPHRDETVDQNQGQDLEIHEIPDDDETSLVGRASPLPRESIGTSMLPDSATVTKLDPDLLTALGETIDDVPNVGPNIHANLAERWMPLLRKGLAKETKEKLTKEYAIPENCSLLRAPKLNAEISAAITDMARNRDKKMENSQQQLGLGITAINRALTTLLMEGDRISAIKHLSDSCRILGDLHFMETQARIKLITPGLTKSFLTIIQDNERDETLFGNKLSDNIKASKAIEKQGLQIKKPAPPKTNTAVASTSFAPSRTTGGQYQGNWNGPARYPSNRGGRGGQRRGTSTPAASNRKNNSQPPTRPAAGQSKQQRGANQ